MTMQLTDAGLHELLNMVTRQQTGFAQPAAPGCWLGLFVAGPTHDLVGTTELGGYNRLNLTSWSAGLSFPLLTLVTAADYVFTALPSATVTGWGLFDDQTAGNLLAFEVFATAQVYVSGDSADVAAGTITVALST